MMAIDANGTASDVPPRPQGHLDEYKSLRDETMKRVEFRNQLWNFTLVTAGGILTFGASEHGTRTAFFLYPVVTLFFASAFSYNTLLLISIGAYIRDVSEKRIAGLGWANFLKDRYPVMERLEHVAKYGLFVGTEILMLAFGIFRTSDELTPVDRVTLAVGIVAVVITVYVLRIPESKPVRGAP